MDPHAEQIACRLSRARRRAFGALVVQYSSAFAFYALLGVAAFRLSVPGGSIALGLGLGFGLLVAWIRAPSRLEVARDLDRRLALGQRLETAVGLLEESDGVSSLLHRDAGRRIEKLDLRRLFPLKLDAGPRGVRITALAVVALSVLLRWLALPEGWGPAGGGAGFPVAATHGSQTASASRPQARRGEATGQRPGAPSELGSAGAGPVPEPESGSPAPGEGTKAVAPEPGTTERSALGGGSADRPQATEVPQAAAPRAADGPIADPRGADSRVAASRTGQPQGQRAPLPSADSRQIPAGAPAGRPAKGESAGTGPVRRSADYAPAGRGPLERAFGEQGMGEDQGSPAAGTSVPGTVGRQSLDPYWSETDSRAVEEALARAQLPPGLRQHVRDYFLAIRRVERR